MKSATLILSFTLLLPWTREGSASQEQIMRGPLQISSDETVSKEHGKLIESSGHVKVHYDMENGDVLTSVSDFARYNETEGQGELTGTPQALWKHSDSLTPSTFLSAQKIVIKIKDREMIAEGKVTIDQGSSTLNAGQVRYFNSDKRLVAEGNRPAFFIRQPNQNIEISAEKVTAWTEKKRIEFTDHVQGQVVFNAFDR